MVIDTLCLQYFWLTDPNLVCSSEIIDERVTMTAKLLAEEIIKSLMGASTISSWQLSFKKGILGNLAMQSFCWL